MGQEESTLVGDSEPPVSLDDRSLEAVAAYINSGKAKHIVVLTGAGISTAAGIPDFRSPKTGLYDHLARLNLPYPEAVFDISFFRTNPQPFYMLAQELHPGRFHPTVSHAFIALLSRKNLLLKLFTQNIDCLERAAGVPPSLIIEAHGSFASQSCIDCRTAFPDEAMRSHVLRAEVARCPQPDCGGLVKPDIVFFGEPLPRTFSEEKPRVVAADLVLVIGTSLTVYPFAGLPDSARAQVPRVLFNKERVGSLGSRPDDVLQLGDCDDGIRRLADLLGWRDELEAAWRETVGEVEADRQMRSQEERDDAVEEEVERLIGDVEAMLKLDDAEDVKTPAVAEKETELADDGVAHELNAAEESKDGQEAVEKKGLDEVADDGVAHELNATEESNDGQEALEKKVPGTTSVEIAEPK